MGITWIDNRIVENWQELEYHLDGEKIASELTKKE